MSVLISRVTRSRLNTGDVEVEWTGLSWSGDGKWIAFNEYGFQG